MLNNYNNKCYIKYIEITKNSKLKTKKKGKNERN